VFKTFATAKPLHDNASFKDNDAVAALDSTAPANVLAQAVFSVSRSVTILNENRDQDEESI